MSKLFAFILISTCLFLTSCGNNQEQVYREAYTAKMQAWEANPAPPGGTIMVGDSITANWLNGFPDGWANRGIGMDTVAGVVQRLPRHLELDQPRRVVLLIGVNQFEHSAADWPLLLQIMRDRPDIAWFVVSLLPNTNGKSGPRIGEFNAWLKELVAGTAVWVDAYSPFMADGRWNVLFTDGLHPSQAGYDLLARVLREAAR